MRWFKPNLRGSFYALFSTSYPSGNTESAAGVEDVRDAMLAMLAEIGEDPAPQLTRRMRYASDIQSLWYLRGDLMAALANVIGEVAAREKITSLTDMFREMLPEGLRSRPSPLSSTPKE
jgi:hypothetical protein